MADLAVGAVTKLLGVIHNETLLLGRVKGDVQFIKEEMESIKSFLARLERTASAAATDTKEDEQLRTWMKQVRDLAHDCSNCIDFYIQRGDPALQRARGGLLRYLWWVSWFVKKMIAQHYAAIQLSKLKDRARDVSERRSRYDVKVPEEAGGAAGPSHAPSVLAGDDDDDDDDDDDGSEYRAALLAGSSGQRRRALGHRFLKDYCIEKLSAFLLRQQHQDRTDQRWTIPSIAIVAPDTDKTRKALDLVPIQFDQKVWINLQQVHGPCDLPLLPQELLCYILQEFELLLLQDKDEMAQDTSITRACTYRSDVIYKTEKMIEGRHFYDKIEEINSKIGQLESKWSNYISDKHFAMLYQALKVLQIGPDINMPLFSREEITLDAAWMLKRHMESVEPEPPILLDISQYKDILHKVFLTSNKEASTSAPPPPVLGEDVIKEIIQIVRELLPKPQLPEGKNSEKEQQAAGTTGMKNATAAEIEEAKQKMNEVYWEFRYQLLIKGIADKINNYLKDKKTLIFLQDDGDYISQWEETRNALSLIYCTLGSAVIVITMNSQKAKEYCYPPGEPITYSVVGLNYDIALQLTREKRTQQEGSYDPQILRDILERCYPHEFAMKVFLQDLYANPNRSSEDLCQLLGNLDSLKSSEGASNSNVANMTMLKFSYSTLPKEYKTCFVYLAIFPPEHRIRRSTLVGRWVAEGLITKGDWASAVRHGERCFDMLIDRWLVSPNDTSATGEVKSCSVGDLVHEFITKIAKKEHIRDARLSHVWARHFSVFSDVRLGASDSIKKFVKHIPKYTPQLQLLKVLDLEGCNCFDKNSYLKNICTSILLLKYLSLRETNVTNLPYEINNLRELEILDIRQTNVPASDTRDVLLLKLKRLLASPADPTPSGGAKNVLYSTVQIPSKIEKMESMEVLSNVMASQDGDELRDIRNLCQLRKLGVVIKDKEVHIKNLLRVVSDRKDCIQSLSITLQPPTRSEGTTPSSKNLSVEIEKEVRRRLERQSKRLESLTINGATSREDLLSLLTKGGDRITKVTLSRTLLKQKNLEDLADLAKLKCIRLRHKAYTEPILTFKARDFQHLRCFLVDGLHKTNTIKFEDNATPELEKITLSLTSTKCLYGVGGLPSLKELELKGNKFLCSLLKDEPTPADGVGMLTFKKEEFQHLERLLINAHLSTEIRFEDGAAPELSYIILFMENVRSLHLAGSLPRLTELELNGNNKPVLLSLLNKSGDRIAKVTISDTLLKQGDLEVLAKKPNLQRLVLLKSSYNENELIFNKDDFPKLTVLTVDCSVINKITFADGAAPKIEKIIWTFSRMESLYGIKNLPKLRRIKLFGDHVPYQVREDIKAHITHIVYTHMVTNQHEDKANGEAEEDQDNDIARFPFSSCLTSKNWCIGANSP